MPHPLSGNLPFEFVVRGKALEEGPCPTLLYFAASAQESLFEDPLCQPSDFFVRENTRVLSVDLPFHSKGISAQESIFQWIQAFLRGDDFFKIFFESLEKKLEQLLCNKAIEPEKFAVAGLSRGGFVALHLAARLPWIKQVLVYAPLTSLEKVYNFQPSQDQTLIEKWSLVDRADQLVDKKIRCYIGNNDTRVDTDSCYLLLRTITNAAVKAGKRSIDVEMIMNPSVGYKGHGTLPYIFKDGIDWINKILDVK